LPFPTLKTQGEGGSEEKESGRRQERRKQTSYDEVTINNLVQGGFLIFISEVPLREERGSIDGGLVKDSY